MAKRCWPVKLIYDDMDLAAFVLIGQIMLEDGINNACAQCLFRLQAYLMTQLFVCYRLLCPNWQISALRNWQTCCTGGRSGRWRLGNRKQQQKLQQQQKKVIGIDSVGRPACWEQQQQQGAGLRQEPAQQRFAVAVAMAHITSSSRPMSCRALAG